MLAATLILLATAGTHVNPSDATYRCSVRILRENPNGYEYTVDQIRQMVNEAEIVVRAVAVGTDRMIWPNDPDRLRPDSGAVAFRVLDALRGSELGARLVLPGYIVDEDDFNTGTVPYAMVRPSGQRGSCFTMEYRLRSQYLLLLKRDGGVLTPHWKALAPANEQVRGGADPWVVWVRQELSADVEHT